jgi:hypothetical protein
LRGHLSYWATFSLSQMWYFNTDLTVFPKIYVSITKLSYLCTQCIT